MYKICQTEQSSRRQRELEQGLLLFMSKRRYEDISVSDLCDFLQIPRKCFYRYFSGKDGALYALLDHTMMDFQMNTLSADISNSFTDLEQYFQFWYDHKMLLDVLQRSGLSGILVERATGFALQERMIPRHMQNWNAQRQSIAMSFAICGLMSMVIQWHHQGFSLSPAEMTQLATTLLERPLLTV